MPIQKPDYEIIDTLFESDRTIVYRAIHKKKNTPVIIKTLSKEYPSLQELTRIRLEYDIINRLDDPGVIKALGLEERGNHKSIIFEDTQAISLAEYGLSELTLDHFFEIAIAIAGILGRIHQKHVIHKDINPYNILINKETRVIKLIDFNNATDLSHDKQGFSTVRQLEGSLAYISPEQTGRMNRVLDYRTDYYSFGITCFQMLTGQLPFNAADAMGYLHCHISRPIPDPRMINPSIPDSASKVVQKLMAKNAENRYQSAYGLIKDLETCRNHWKSSNMPQDFTPGSYDLPERFQIPQKLFGRHKEIEALMSAFENVSAGSMEFLLVSGHAGVGKSSLVQEAHKRIIDQNGYFVSGKFDPFEWSIPYCALLQALRKLVRLLLSESDSKLDMWRNKLLTVLGINASLLTELVPDFETIIGTFPPVVSLNPKESQVRFQTVFHDVIALFAEQEHPLVVFLDDLQWSDAATIDLLMYLISNTVDYLMIIGTYRNDELEEGHPFQIALDDLHHKRLHGSVLPQTIRLEPLNQGSITDIVAEIFHRTSKSAADLAALVFKKTGGNPFFSIELLHMLNQAGAFEFQADQGHWHIDLDKAEKNITADSVIEILVQQIQQLPADTQNVLKLASCFGNTFELEDLSAISHKTVEELNEPLRQAVEKIMLMPLDKPHASAVIPQQKDLIRDEPFTFKFQHDRILQAVHSLISEEEKPAIHLQIGRFLLASSNEQNLEQRIFDIVRHLNRAWHLIDDEKERNYLVVLNHIAGKKAKDTAAFDSAADYLGQALSFAKALKVPLEHNLEFEIMRNYAECLCLSGHAETSLEICSKLFELAAQISEKSACFILKARILNHQSKMLESLDTIREGLKLFSLVLPDNHREIDQELKKGIDRLKEHLSHTPIHSLVDLPEMKNEETILAMKLLFEATPPAIQTHPPLFTLIGIIMFDLAIQHGTTPTSCKNFIDCAITLGNMFGDYQSAYELAQVAFKLVAKFKAVAIEPSVCFVFATFISHWRAHYKESMSYFDKALKTALEAGDGFHLPYIYCHRLHRLPFIGTDLRLCKREAEKTISALEKLKAYAPLDIARITEHMIFQLTGEPGTKSDLQLKNQADDLFKTIKNSDNIVNLLLYAQSRAYVYYLLDKTEEAVIWDEFAREAEVGGVGMFSMRDLYLIRSLILTRSWKTASESRRLEMIVLLRECLEKLKYWSENSPANVAHKYYLVVAEFAKVKGDPMETVISFYDKAREAIETGEFIHMKALINELQGEFWLERQQPKIAKLNIGEAHHLYQQWGASRKVNALERKYFKWFSNSTDHDTLLPLTSFVSGQSLDVSSILKSTQAISSEIRIEKLEKKLVYTMMENAGAQRGYLILKRKGDPILYVEASGDGENILVNRSIPLEDLNSDLCVDIVHYVARSQNVIVLNDAQNEENYRCHPCINQHGISSVLCLPVVYQTVLKGVLYLENNLLTNAFSPSHVTVLSMISSQAAISLENAYVYNNLDQLVQKRTAQLEKVQAELVENAHKAGMSDIATNILHNVGNILNSLKTTGYLLNETVVNSRTHDLAKANALLKDNMHDLQQFILHNPNGEKLFRYYLELGTAINEEGAAMLDHVRQMQENIEVIATMIAAQQKYVYTSHFAESIDPQEILDNALAISLSNLKRAGISIHKKYTDVPRIKSHKVKLLHVLVNLIKNAEDAILKSNRHQKHITLTVEHNNDLVWIKVSDNGCGIKSDCLTKVFSLGFTTKPDSQGIGLHSSAIYVSEMGGKIWAESDGEGKGTIMNLQLPITQETNQEEL